MKTQNNTIKNLIRELEEDLSKEGFETEKLQLWDDMEMALGEVMRLTSNLAKVFQNSPDSICIADAEGKLLAVNKAFEHTVGASADEVTGRNVLDLEEEGVFRPSVLRLAKEEKRPITILQVGRHGKQIMVTGVPVFDEDGKIELLVSNARMTDEIEGLYAYIDSQRHEGKQEQRNDDELIMKSEEMSRIISVADQVKNTDATILITGPSGVGKGIMARYIHNTSNRAEMPLVEINCGAIPEKLIESELFGYEAGAFTGASKEGNIGLIETADGGTLMLDEISEMPLFLQVKLLKVIQDREIMRIGSRTSKKVDVRIIAATNKNLQQLVQNGEFREDLYYRLNVIPINIPPLKYRPDDIKAAMDHFVRKFSDKYQRNVDMTREFREYIMSQEWPGNMRELENFLERAVLTSRDGILRVASDETLKLEVTEKLLHGIEEKGAYEGLLDQAEGEIIRTFYDRFHSSYKVAAELGISQSKAYRLIRKYIGDGAE